MGINSIIIEEDEEQSIKKSKENHDSVNKVPTVSDYSLNHKYSKGESVVNPLSVKS